MATEATTIYAMDRTLESDDGFLRISPEESISLATTGPLETTEEATEAPVITEGGGGRRRDGQHFGVGLLQLVTGEYIPFGDKVLELLYKVGSPPTSHACFEDAHFWKLRPKAFTKERWRAGVVLCNTTHVASSNATV
jgi:hypothetical protein